MPSPPHHYDRQGRSEASVARHLPHQARHRHSQPVVGMLFRAGQPTQHGALVVLPTEEYREHAYEPTIIIHVEIEYCPPLCDRPQAWENFRPKRSLVGKLTQTKHFGLDPLNALGCAVERLAARITKTHVAFEQEVEDRSKILVGG